MLKEYSYGIIPVFQNLNGELQVLLIQNKGGGHRGFPKGHQEAGEPPLHTAIRELQEETGLEIKQTQSDNMFTEQYTFQTQSKKIYKQVGYFVGYVQSQDIHIQQDEIMDYKRINIDQAQDQITHDGAKNILQQVKQTIQNSKTNI